MSTNKNIDKICCVILAVTILISCVAVGINALDFDGGVELGYELKLFDDSYVHTLDIVTDSWCDFLENCENEEYVDCSVVIDGESYKNVGIRAKGNTSLSKVSQYGNNRYSFKIEFDRYETKTYHGLDKLSLNNIIQDNTYMKDYLVYTLMNKHGVSTPLCSFVNITVNGEIWGLYLAVEGIEDGFLQRNYGTDHGELYKPDSMNMGAGRGNGKDFDGNMSDGDFSIPEDKNADADGNFGSKKDMPNRENQNAEPNAEKPMKGGFGSEDNMKIPENFERRDDGDFSKNAPDIPRFDGEGDLNNVPDPPQFDGEDNANGVPDPPQFDSDENGNGRDNGKGMGGLNGSDDVLLKYTDDDYDSYANIFDNAKTDITNADKKRLINALKTLNSGENAESCVDVESVIRYFVVHNFVCNFDSYTGQMIHNYYLYEKDGVLSMLPWDYNLAFGGFMSGTDATSLVNFPIDTPVSGGSVEDRPMLKWIFADSEYTELYHQYMSEFISDVFDSGWFEEKYTQVIEMISPYVENDPTSFCTYGEFKTGADTLKTFCELRAESVKGQLNGTVPSTSEGQLKDKTNFVDASGLDITLMGENDTHDEIPAEILARLG